jgi:threonine dehydratase
MVDPLIATPGAGVVSLADIQLAAVRLKDVTRRTPLVPLSSPDGRSRCAIKLESLQATGAFKFRGAYNAVAGLREQASVRGVIAASTGNHAIGVARAARILGVPAVIVMPASAPMVKREAVKADGAELLLLEGSTEHLIAAATAIAQERQYSLISSYDNPLVVAGQGTVGLELLEQLAELVGRGEADVGPPIVLAPLGGGGLASGIAIAVKSLAPGSLVVGVEPTTVSKGRDSLALGRLVTWPDEELARTSADGLRISTLGRLPWDILRSWLDGVLTVSESAIADAMRLAAFEGHVVLEPAGAAAIAAWLVHALPRGPVVCICSGGNVDPERFFELACTPR